MTTGPGHYDDDGAYVYGESDLFAPDGQFSELLNKGLQSMKGVVRNVTIQTISDDPSIVEAAAELAQDDAGLVRAERPAGRLIGFVDPLGFATFMVADLDDDGGPIPSAADLIFSRATLDRLPLETRTAIAADVGDRLGVTITPKMAGVHAPVVDESGRMLFTSTADDGGMLPFWIDWHRQKFAEAQGWITVDQLADDVLTSFSTPGYVTETTGGSPNRAIYATARATADRRLIANTDDPHNPEMTSDGWVLFDAAGERRARKADGTGDVVPAVTRLDSLSSWGDSLTAVYTGIGIDDTETFTYLLAQQLGLGANYYNGGRGGQHMEEIATRAGGIVLKLSAGITVPATTTSVAVVPDRIINAYITASQGWDMTCTLDGIAGTLTRTPNTNNYTFKRTTVGAAVDVPAGTPFRSVEGEGRKSSLQIVGGGMNDLLHNTDSSAVLTQRVIDATLAIYEHHAAYAKRVLFIGTITRTDWGVGTGGYQRVQTINDGIQEAVGDLFVPVRDLLIANAPAIMAAQGITPTADDLAKLAADTLPPSIMADATHYKDFVHAAIESYLYARITQKGWTA